MTSNDVKLNDLDSTLKQIDARLDQEINDNPNNINTYDSSSISIIVYEAGYIDYDARSKDYNNSGKNVAQFRDIKFALYEEKVRDSDNA
ncbi:hypothetical protein [Fusibacter ferrireducens]|uniref:Uncharacterized protein n=1 Tax=Fusibacter ferrireducens TaxID=2785058 RepID=A0ABR9ZVV8_9FIRM|nr:hypothetical protein [Fusibacter ferrireducens]MBF4694599.1 hypothetical protein [Fusibacter ferrireducens]